MDFNLCLKWEKRIEDKEWGRHTPFTPDSKNKLKTIKVIGTAQCPVRKTIPTKLLCLSLCFCSNLRMPACPSAIGACVDARHADKSSIRADSIGTLIDEASSDRWGPMPLSSGEAGWLEKGCRISDMTLTERTGVINWWEIRGSTGDDFLCSQFYDL